MYAVAERQAFSALPAAGLQTAPVLPVLIAYSTPDAVHFYERNGFREFDSELFLRRENYKIDGCIPMYYTL